MSNTTRTSGIQLSLCTRAHNPDHHLWNNHGTWWCHFTVHTAEGQKRRVRRSLRTPQLDAARRRRDVVLAGLATLAASAHGTLRNFGVSSNIALLPP